MNKKFKFPQTGNDGDGPQSYPALALPPAGNIGYPSANQGITCTATYGIFLLIQL